MAAIGREAKLAWQAAQARRGVALRPDADISEVSRLYSIEQPLLTQSGCRDTLGDRNWIQRNSMIGCKRLGCSG